MPQCSLYFIFTFISVLVCSVFLVLPPWLESLRVSTAGNVTLQDIYIYIYTHTHIKQIEAKTIWLSIAPSYCYWNQWESDISIQCSRHHTRRQDLISLSSRITIPSVAELGAQWEMGLGSPTLHPPLLAPSSHWIHAQLESQLFSKERSHLFEKQWLLVPGSCWSGNYISTFFFFLSHWALTHYANSACFFLTGAVSCC